jgi:chromosome segregation ATPase
MQVKDYLQALTDEGKIRVEKIGSGNWYWSFLSEEKKARDNVIMKLKDEEEKLDSTINELRGRLSDATNRREEDGDGREELLVMHAKLTEEVNLLKEELNEYKDGDPGEVIRKKREVEQYKEKAYRWTENLELLEGWLGKVAGGDKERIEGIKRTFYGDEYVEGEGLREL